MLVPSNRKTKTRPTDRKKRKGRKDESKGQMWQSRHAGFMLTSGV